MMNGDTISPLIFDRFDEQSLSLKLIALNGFWLSFLSTDL